MSFKFYQSKHQRLYAYSLSGRKTAFHQRRNAMVQVDVFWAYGLGAGLAAAAGRQLKEKDNIFVTPYFVKTLLFLSLVWAPTGMLLLLKHPSWECMQVPDKLSDIPPWLILGFGITNVTQGILGYWVTSTLYKNGKYYLANLNWLAGYLGMFFILVYGWDGLGWDRFLYDRDIFGAAWQPGLDLTFMERLSFLWSSVAITLYIDGIYLIPPLIFMITAWYSEGARSDNSIQEKEIPSKLTVTFIYLFIILGVALGTAMGAGLTVYILSKVVGHIPSYFTGLPLFGALAWLLLYRKGMPVHSLFRKYLYLKEAE